MKDLKYSTSAYLTLLFHKVMLTVFSPLSSTLNTNAASLSQFVVWTVIKHVKDAWRSNVVKEQRASVMRRHQLYSPDPSAFLCPAMPHQTCRTRVRSHAHTSHNCRAQISCVHQTFYAYFCLLFGFQSSQKRMLRQLNRVYLTVTSKLVNQHSALLHKYIFQKKKFLCYYRPLHIILCHTVNCADFCLTSRMDSMSTMSLVLGRISSNHTHWNNVEG